MAELLDAIACMVTVPDAPATHCATPFWLIVAMLGSELDQLPEYGETNGTGTVAGDGAMLNVPVGMNCTCPCGKLCASALAGLRVID
jgi:hypothetical protein